VNSEHAEIAALNERVNGVARRSVETAEQVVRQQLADVTDQLENLRAMRGQINGYIKDMVAEQTVLERVSAVFDRADKNSEMNEVVILGPDELNLD
jgi:hypothetical protein